MTSKISELRVAKQLPRQDSLEGGGNDFSPVIE